MGAGRKDPELDAYRKLKPGEFSENLRSLREALQLAEEDSPKVFVGAGKVGFLRQLVEHFYELVGPEGEGTLAWYSELTEAIDDLEWGSPAQRIAMRMVASRMMSETDPRARSEAEKEILRAVKSRTPPESKQAQSVGSVTIGDDTSSLDPAVFGMTEDGG
jgi:hypothetical protein